MTHLSKAILIIASLGLAACTNPDGLGGGANGGANGALGSVSDPHSIAYFNQTVGDRVLFVVDTSNLTPQGRAVIAEQAKWMTENPEYSAKIEGHADERGTREYNLALGARRANAVSEFLIDRGVAANRLRTVTYGKERPLEICSAESCYANNRRAVTVLSAGAGF